MAKQNPPEPPDPPTAWEIKALITPTFVKRRARKFG